MNLIERIHGRKREPLNIFEEDPVPFVDEAKETEKVREAVHWQMELAGEIVNRERNYNNHLANKYGPLFAAVAISYFEGNGMNYHRFDFDKGSPSSEHLEDLSRDELRSVFAQEVISQLQSKEVQEQTTWFNEFLSDMQTILDRRK